MQPQLPPPPPPPPPRSAYFVPPPAPPPPPAGPPAFSGVGTIFVTLGVLVALALTALFVLPAILHPQKSTTTDRADDDSRPKPKPSSSSKKTVDVAPAKVLP